MLLCLLTIPSVSIGAEDLSPGEMLDFFRFSDDERKAIMDGEIVGRSQAALEGSKKGLAISVAMIIPHRVEDCIEIFAGTELFRLDRKLLDFEIIEITEGRVAADAFARVGFTESEAKEVERLLDFRGGSELNLSKQEIQTFRDLDGSNLKTVNDSYRQLLAERLESYLEKGPAGVAPYERKKGQAKPGEELTIAANNSPMLQRRVPDFYAYLTDPDAASQRIEDRYYWTKHEVQERPAFSLIHWMIDVDPNYDYAFLAEREFFAGHTYNSMTVYFGLFPFGDDVMVFYLNRTFTDRVAGFGSGLAHKIGRGRMVDAVTERFEAMRVELAKAEG